jgi:cytochrome c556
LFERSSDVIARKSLFRYPAVSSFMVVAGTALLVTVVAGAVADSAKPAAAAKAADIAAAAEDLVKSLETTVADATAFKQGEEDVARKGAIIAILANAVSEAEGDAKWKGSALAVRDAAMTLAKAKGQPAADKALKEIKALLDGGKGGEGKAMKYLDITSLETVMKEVNERKKTMTKNLRGTNFTKNKEAIARDATVWAVLAGVARADTHAAEHAKKPQADFEKLADDFFTHAKSLAAAAAKGDQSASTEANKAVSKACTDCHAGYRPDIQ